MKERKWNHTTDKFMDAIDIPEEEWDRETSRLVARMDEIHKEHPEYGRSLVIQVLVEEFDPTVALAMYEDIVSMNIKREMFGELLSGLRSSEQES